MERIAVLDQAEKNRRTISSATDRKKKSALGQFMTPASLAAFMAGLFEIDADMPISLLDAGAGLGALTCAFLDRLPQVASVRCDAFEIDSEIACHLRDVLKGYGGRGVVPYIREADFIEEGTDLAVRRQRPYSHAILNPPYKKITASSWHRKELRRAGIETVNLYSGFVALAIEAMQAGGQMVVIIPRSFTNGPYYAPFRKLMLSRMSIRRMHLFDSRNKAFKDDAVLQETLIMHLERDGVQGNVTVSRSTDAEFNDMEIFDLPFTEIVRQGDSERFIHVPSNGSRSDLESILSEAVSLAELGLKVSTGPVVDFRMREHLRSEAESEGSIPLLYPRNFRSGQLEWPIPGGKKPNAIAYDDDTRKLMYPNGWYAVCRRFTAKEERRRVVAGVIDPRVLGDVPAIGIENHVNVFHAGKRGLSEITARGLAAFLNTTAVDDHLRRFNGHTQVNAGDLKVLPYPDLNALQSLGNWASETDDYSQEAIDIAFKKLT